MNNNRPLISVIMSVYNSESTIEQSIESLLQQTYKNIEIYLIDDGSTDDSYKIIKNYSSKFTRIKSFKNPQNIGLTKSLNILAKEVEGPLIARQDADDFSYETRFEEQFSYLNKKSLNACTTRAKIMNTEKLIPGFSFFIPNRISIKFKNPFIHGTLLIEKSTFFELGCYDEKFRYAQDYKLMTDLINKKYKVSILNRPLYHLNMEGNISSEFKKEQRYYAECVKNNIEP